MKGIFGGIFIVMQAETLGDLGIGLRRLPVTKWPGYLAQEKPEHSYFYAINKKKVSKRNFL